MTQIIDEVHEILPQVTGMSCWRVNSCTVDSSLSIDFGKTVFYKTVTGKVHSEGELNFLIWSPAWRLDTVDDAICSSSCTKEQIFVGTQNIIGQTVQTIEIFPPVWDAIVTFSSNMKLHIFCTDLFEEYPANNWSLTFGKYGYYFGCGCGKQIFKESRIGICDEDFSEQESRNTEPTS